jgi:hypothetical protein
MSLLRRLTPLQLQSSFRSLPRTTYHQPISRFHASAQPRLQVLPNMAGERPTGLKANKGIELLTWGTPNGVKASILLEELKEAYGMVSQYWTFQE